MTIDKELLIILTPLFVGTITQVVKFSLYARKYGLKWNYFMTHGHMPSTHSSFAVSVLLTVGFINGIYSGAFAVAMALAIIIIDDALRIRMYLGDQGRYLNMLVQSLNLDISQYPRLKERVGHRTSEVIVGLIFGALLSLTLLYFFSSLSFSFAL